MEKKENMYIDNSRFKEFIDELATQITEERCGDEAYASKNLFHGYKFTEEAQKYYDERYDEYETMVNKIMGVYKHSDMITHIYPIK